MKEMEIKKKLVKHLVDSSSEQEVIAAEVIYQSCARRADVVSFTDTKATSFEIKGSSDTVDKLDYQLKSYKEYFDYCYVVCEQDNLNQVRKSIGKEIGIIVVNNDSVSRIRKSSLFKKQNKISLASTISSSTLSKLAPKSAKSKYEKCIYVADNMKLSDVRELSRLELKEKLSVKFKQFLSDLGEQINADDIVTLTRSSSELIRAN